ncbi:MAG: hypothetical protein ACYTEW_22560, partial [Planctomycetota bacterium]
MISVKKSKENKLFFKTFVFLFFCMLLTSVLLSETDAAVMEDYCAVPPYVVSAGAAPPDIMIAYEKGIYSSAKRAYNYTYDPNTEYYGYFDIDYNYTFSVSGGNRDFAIFEKSACTPSAAALDCIPGNILNWATMSSLDLSRKAMLGFGWPRGYPDSQQSAGDVFRYTGNFAHGNPTPRTIAQFEDQMDDTPMKQGLIVTRNLGGSDYTYRFCLEKGKEFYDATQISITVRSGSDMPDPDCLAMDTCGSGSYDNVNDSKGRCLGVGRSEGNGSGIPGGGGVIIKFADADEPVAGAKADRRYGVLQKFIDKNQDYIYDADAPMFGVRRYSDDKWKHLDIFCKDASIDGCTEYCSNDDITPYFPALLDAMLIQPHAETTTAYVSDMMKYITEYFNQHAGAYPSSLKYYDELDFTQTPYNWCEDPDSSLCGGGIYVLFITTGSEQGSTLSDPMHSDCSSGDVGGSERYFAQNVCNAYLSDMTSAHSGLQNINTYVVHTSFSWSESCTQDSDCPDIAGTWNKCIDGYCNASEALQHAVSFGGGNYYNIDEPSKFEEILEEAILSMLARASSGTAASVLASAEGSGANLVQGIFFPMTQTVDAGGVFDREIGWIGKLSNLWYYVDPFFTFASVREETDGLDASDNHVLDLKKDYISEFEFVEAADHTITNRCIDVDGDGGGDDDADGNCDNLPTPDDLILELIPNLWDAGVL